MKNLNQRYKTASYRLVNFGKGYILSGKRGELMVVNEKLTKYPSF